MHAFNIVFNSVATDSDFLSQSVIGDFRTDVVGQTYQNLSHNLRMLDRLLFVEISKQIAFAIVFQI